MEEIEELCQERLSICGRLLQLEVIPEEVWCEDPALETEYLGLQSRLKELEEDVSYRLGYHPFSHKLEEYRNYYITQPAIRI